MHSRFCSTFIFVVLILFAGSFVGAETQMDRVSAELRSDGEMVAKWSFIVRVDGGDPFVARRLYEDHSGNLLVIRDYSDQNDLAMQSIEHLQSGHLLEIYNVDSSTVVVKLRRQQGSPVQFSYDIQSLFDMQGQGDLPPQLAADASNLLAQASGEFRTALRNLAVVGCRVDVTLYTTAVGFANLFYDPQELRCELPPTSMTRTKNETRLKEFDPWITPPTPFEQQFGDAYYE